MSMTMFYITLDPSYKARAAHHRATPHTPILTSVVGVGRGTVERGWYATYYHYQLCVRVLTFFLGR